LSGVDAATLSRFEPLMQRCDATGAQLSDAMARGDSDLVRSLAGEVAQILLELQRVLPDLAAQLSNANETVRQAWRIRIENTAKPLRVAAALSDIQAHAANSRLAVLARAAGLDTSYGPGGELSFKPA
jgi:hypothetical protein